MAFKCPSCERPLYNRRRSDCEFCLHPLPAALQLSAAQQAVVDREKHELHERRRARDVETWGPKMGTGDGLLD